MQDSIDQPRIKDLGTFLREHAKVEEQQSQIKDLLRSTGSLFLRAKLNRPDWPYSCEPQEDGSLKHMYSAADRPLSISTQSMCCAGIEKLLFADKLYGFLRQTEREPLRNAQLEAAGKILATIKDNWKDQDKKELWFSSTYGKNDVFTASWLIVILQQSKHWSQAEREKYFAWPDELLRELIKIISDAADKGLATSTDKSLFEKDGANEAGAHSLPLLKLVSAVQIIDQDSQLKGFWTGKMSPSTVVKSAGNWLEKNLHRQMSFYRFKDFRFDAAELVFCLQGTILTNVITQYEPIISDVLGIIREAQGRSVYWRPYRPMMSTSQGAVLLPLSIEVATALICTLESSEKFNHFQDTLSKYFLWLFNQRLESSSKELDGKASWVGWHSENSYEANVVHVWDTSLVSIFLVELLKNVDLSGQKEVLKSAGFAVEPPDHKFIDLIPFDKGLPQNSVDVVNDEFISPDGTKPHKKSLLIYGPPGASKTTLARHVAAKLDRKLVYLSPSDFISHGEAGIEEQAKNIFKALQMLGNHVIFFDEIDRMILDRDSEPYGQQGDMFQFMTPGMLTKLSNLHDKGRSIFIIATNYEERIDKAIKRQGRVDLALLWLPYDLSGRVLQLKKMIDSRFPGNDSGKVLEWNAEIEENLKKVVKNEKCSLYIYPELEKLLEKIDWMGLKGKNLQAFHTQAIEELAGVAYSEIEPAQLSLGAYNKRTIDKPEKPQFPQTPYEEHAALLLIAGESNPANKSYQRIFKKVLKVWKKDPEGNFETKWPSIQNRAAAYGLQSWLPR